MLKRLKCLCSSCLWPDALSTIPMPTLSSTSDSGVVLFVSSIAGFSISSLAIAMTQVVCSTSSDADHQSRRSVKCDKIESEESHQQRRRILLRRRNAARQRHDLYYLLLPKSLVTAFPNHDAHRRHCLQDLLHLSSRLDVIHFGLISTLAYAKGVDWFGVACQDQ
jgi:hypothetical protein